MFYKKRLGQHLLTNSVVLEKIASLIPLEGETVLEIGAGKGGLTQFLARKAKKVVALEIDSRFVSFLKERFSREKNVEIISADALEFDFTSFKIFFGNLPYNISSPLLFKVFETNFSKAVFCLQKEFAERLVAQPGSKEYSRLSVMAQNEADIIIAMNVPSRDFFPKPRVDSSIVLFSRNKKFFLNPLLVNALFQHKNQSIRNSLIHSSSLLGFSKKELNDFAESLSFSKKKVKLLSLEEFSLLSNEFQRFSKGR